MPSTASHYPPPTPPPQPLQSPPITIVLTVILLIFLLLGFFSIYFCRCFLEAIYNTWHLRRTTSGHLEGPANNADVPDPPTGLSPIIVKSFPTFVFSSIKEVCKEKYGLECAICLVEFEDNSLLRLLFDCYHVFHQECIDLWLQSHKTCPVCRRNLDRLPENNMPPILSNGGNIIVNDEFAIDVRGENNDTNDSQLLIFGPSTTPASAQIEELLALPKCGGGRLNGEGFSRSHSTGHSITRARSRSEEEARDDQDRYRLRLPEHVKKKHRTGHHWTGSCETYVDFQRHRCTTSPNAVGRRLGEISGSHH